MLHSVGLRCELLGHVAVVDVVVGKVLHVVTQSAAVAWTEAHWFSSHRAASDLLHVTHRLGGWGEGVAHVTFSELGEVRGNGRGGAGRKAQDAERLQQRFLAGWTSADPSVGGQGAQGHLLRGLQAPLDLVVGDQVLS